MKARTLILASAILVAALSSCRKEDPVYIEECDCTMESVLINVKSSDWIYSNENSNNYFYATVNMPEITEDIFKMGLIKMYRAYSFGSPGAVQIEMPFTRHLERCLDEEKDIWEFYTETLDYEFSVGTMTIYYTMSNFDYEIDLSIVPDNMQFRCVVMK